MLPPTPALDQELALAEQAELLVRSTFGLNERLARVISKLTGDSEPLPPPGYPKFSVLGGLSASREAVHEAHIKIDHLEQLVGVEQADQCSAGPGTGFNPAATNFNPAATKGSPHVVGAMQGARPYPPKPGGWVGPEFEIDASDAHLGDLHKALGGIPPKSQGFIIALLLAFLKSWLASHPV